VRQQVLDKTMLAGMILLEDTLAKWRYSARPSSSRTGSFLPITERFSRGMRRVRVSIACNIVGRWREDLHDYSH